jgi:hypothetical protein
MFYYEDDLVTAAPTHMYVPVRPDGQTGRMRMPDHVHATWCPKGSACPEHGGRVWPGGIIPLAYDRPGACEYRAAPSPQLEQPQSWYVATLHPHGFPGAGFSRHTAVFTDEVHTRQLRSFTTDDLTASSHPSFDVGHPGSAASHRRGAADDLIRNRYAMHYQRDLAYSQPGVQYFSPPQPHQMVAVS